MSRSNTVIIMIKGRIHSFESFGTLDGPGIRFVVFMQGCPLRCLYCHNRDTWDMSGGKEYTPEEVFNEAKKYMSYFKYSGGGITVTGGEPTLQAEFVTELFRKCKKAGIHTTLDTSGFADIDKVKELLKYTDLVLLDIKHGIKEKHKLLTGVSNDKILEFAHYLCEKNIPVWIRYVLVPGLTDAPEDLESAAAIIGSLKNIKKVEVLPYHCMGAYKWSKLGYEYSLEGVREPTSEEVARASKVLSEPLKAIAK